MPHIGVKAARLFVRKALKKRSQVDSLVHTLQYFMNNVSFVFSVKEKRDVLELYNPWKKICEGISGGLDGIKIDFQENCFAVQVLVVTFVSC